MAEPDRRVTPQLVLASTSRYRRELLERLDVPFVAAAPAFDEQAHEQRFDPQEPEAFARYLARGKAASLRAAYKTQWILAADQIAIVGDPPTLLHKPGEFEAAVDQLARLSGRVHRLITGVVLLGPAGELDEETDDQSIRLRSLERREIEQYVGRYQPYDCVGSYRVEDAGIRLIESIIGQDYTGIIGLPLLAVCRLLRRRGLLS